MVGAILAGGASSRMGEPKQNIVFRDSTPMIAHVHAALAAVCHRVVVLGDSVHLSNLERLDDLRAGRGPLGGIEALLKSGMSEQYLVVPCDLPQITADVLRALVSDSEKPASIFAGRPLPARMSVSALPTVQRLLDDDDRAVWRLMDELEAECVSLPDAWSALLENVNTPADMERLTVYRNPPPGPNG